MQTLKEPDQMQTARKLSNEHSIKYISNIKTNLLYATDSFAMLETESYTSNMSHCRSHCGGKKHIQISALNLVEVDRKCSPIQSAAYH